MTLRHDPLQRALDAVSMHAAQVGREVRQLYARDTRLPPEAPLFFLEEGAAAAARPDCHDGRLICPIPGCETPQYSTRGGRKRDHFFHVNAPAVSHNPESYDHYTAKRLVGEWVSEKYPEARVIVDHEPVENGQVPDVLVEMPIQPDHLGRMAATPRRGVRYAFEIQYSPITWDEWQRRHNEYRKQGIMDIWLWGHLGVHGRRWRDGPLRFSDLHAWVERKTYLIRWIDPEERVLYASPNFTNYTGHKWVPRRGGSIVRRPRREPCDSLELDAKGLVSPLLREEREAYREMSEQQRQDYAKMPGAERRAGRRMLEQQRQEEAAEREADRRRLEQQRQEREAEREADRRMREQQRQEKEADPQRQALLARRKDEQGAVYTVNDGQGAKEWNRKRARLEKRHGPLPKVIYVPHKKEIYVNAPPAFWHAMVMSKVLEGRISQTRNLGHCYRAVEDWMSKQSDLGSEALIEYLEILVSHGYITREEPVDGSWVFRVLHDLTHPPEGEPYADNADGARRQVTSDGEIVARPTSWTWWRRWGG